MHISYESQRKNNKLFCAVKGRNISVGDVVSHMSDGIFIRNLFLVSKWMEPYNCLRSCAFLGVAFMVTYMMYDAMGL